jgi:hypothetical protein
MAQQLILIYRHGFVDGKFDYRSGTRPKSAILKAKEYAEKGYICGGA